MTTTNSRMPKGKAPVSVIKSYANITGLKNDEKKTVSRHDPNKIVITSDNDKNKESLKIHKQYNNYSKNKYQISYDNDYFEERENEIVEEMRLKLSQDAFEDWYSHHLGLSDESEYSSFSDSESDY